MTGDKILPVNSHELQQKLIQNPFEDDEDEEEEKDINNIEDCLHISSCVYLCCLFVVMIIIIFQSANN